MLKWTLSQIRSRVFLTFFSNDNFHFFYSEKGEKSSKRSLLNMGGKVVKKSVSIS